MRHRPRTSSRLTAGTGPPPRPPTGSGMLTLKRMPPGHVLPARPASWLLPVTPCWTCSVYTVSPTSPPSAACYTVPSVSAASEWASQQAKQPCRGPGPRCAETFLQLYPSAKFICLHRRCPEVILAGVNANPWGLEDSAFKSFTAGYPGNAVAAIAAYWAASTEPLLEFEQAHPGSCHRVRYEDLTSCPDQARAEIASFLPSFLPSFRLTKAIRRHGT